MGKPRKLNEVDFTDAGQRMLQFAFACRTEARQHPIAAMYRIPISW